jgi:hypothetical protein
MAATERIRGRSTEGARKYARICKSLAGRTFSEWEKSWAGARDGCTVAAASIQRTRPRTSKAQPVSNAGDSAIMKPSRDPLTTGHACPARLAWNCRHVLHACCDARNATLTEQNDGRDNTDYLPTVPVFPLRARHLFASVFSRPFRRTSPCGNTKREVGGRKFGGFPAG